MIKYFRKELGRVLRRSEFFFGERKKTREKRLKNLKKALKNAIINKICIVAGRDGGVMKKVWKKIGKISLIVVGGILALVLLALAVLNLLKFAIYKEYYAIETTVCKIPGTDDGLVCQGICASEEDGVIIVSGYMNDDSASRLYITNESNQARFVRLMQNGKPFTGHVGGVATARGNVYIADDGRIYELALQTLLKAKSGGALEIGAGTPVNTNASFVYADDDYLYVGEFHDGGKYTVKGHENQTAEGTHYALCSKYALGDLSNPVKVYSIRNKVQGICFTPNGEVVLATSYGLDSSTYYLYDESAATDSGKTVDGAPLVYLDKVVKTLKGPAMAEGLDYYKGKIITLTESASDKYIFGKFFNARHIVGLNFHK